MDIINFISLVEVSERNLCLLVYGMKLTMLRISIVVVTGYGVTECKTKQNEWVTNLVTQSWMIE